MLSRLRGYYSSCIIPHGTIVSAASPSSTTARFDEQSLPPPLPSPPQVYGVTLYTNYSVVYVRGTPPYYTRCFGNTRVVSKQNISLSVFVINHHMLDEVSGNARIRIPSENDRTPGLEKKKKNGHDVRGAVLVTAGCPRTRRNSSTASTSTASTASTATTPPTGNLLQCRCRPALPQTRNQHALQASGLQLFVFISHNGTTKRVQP